jgi:hypothetical protein
LSGFAVIALHWLQIRKIPQLFRAFSNDVNRHVTVHVFRAMNVEARS